MSHYRSNIMNLSVSMGNVLNKLQIEALFLDDYSQPELEKWCSLYNEMQIGTYDDMYKGREETRLWAEICNWADCLCENKRIETLWQSGQVTDNLVELCLIQICNCIGYITPDPHDGGGELFRLSALDHIAHLIKEIYDLDKENWFIANTINVMEQYYLQNAFVDKEREDEFMDTIRQYA